MPIRPLSILDRSESAATPASAAALDKNWKILSSNMKTGNWTPVLTGFTLAPTVVEGFYTFYGPLAFIYVQINNNLGGVAFGWAINSTISIPIMPVLDATGNPNRDIQMLSPPIDNNSQKALTAEWTRISWTAGAPYIFLPAVNLVTTLQMSIQGWFYRN